MTLRTMRSLLVALLLLAPLIATSSVEDNARTLDLSRRTDILDRFKDCSTGFWFDRKQQMLIGSGFKLDVPKSAVTSVGDGYVRIRTKAQLHGFPTEWLFVPGFEIGDAGGQNSVAVVGQIEKARDAFARSWGLRFVKGIPDGPDIDPKAVAYFSDPPKGRPSLDATSHSAKQTVITCPVWRGGSAK